MNLKYYPAIKYILGKPIRVGLKLALLIIVFSCSKRNSEVDIDTQTKNDTIRVSPQQVDHMLSPRLIIKPILNKLEVLIPKDFIIMNADMVTVKYPLKRGSIFEVYANKEETINLTAFAKGVYFVRVISKNNSANFRLITE